MRREETLSLLDPLPRDTARCVMEPIKRMQVDDGPTISSEI